MEDGVVWGHGQLLHGPLPRHVRKIFCDVRNVCEQQVQRLDLEDLRPEAPLPGGRQGHDGDGVRRVGDQPRDSVVGRVCLKLILKLVVTPRDLVPVHTQLPPAHCLVPEDDDNLWVHGPLVGRRSRGAAGMHRVAAPLYVNTVLTHRDEVDNHGLQSEEVVFRGPQPPLTKHILPPDAHLVVLVRLQPLEFGGGAPWGQGVLHHHGAVGAHHPHLVPGKLPGAAVRIDVGVRVHVCLGDWDVATLGVWGAIHEGGNGGGPVLTHPGHPDVCLANVLDAQEQLGQRAHLLRHTPQAPTLFSARRHRHRNQVARVRLQVGDLKFVTVVNIIHDVGRGPPLLHLEPDGSAGVTGDRC
mmetsp:Transcript_38575/g.69046  ORF Transcript_38575/g.69046 Transcript_38575/m.69046 type:complete len:354 (+) Transcript_38575:7455-8516(+)